MPRTLTLVALALIAVTTPVRAQSIPYVTVQAYHYLPGDTRDGTTLEITQGELLHFVNVDLVGGFHTLTATDAVDGIPIFDTGTVTPPGAQSDVTGTEKLKPGTYLFYCASHGAAAMSGTLRVVR